MEAQKARRRLGDKRNENERLSACWCVDLNLRMSEKMIETEQNGKEESVIELDNLHFTYPGPGTSVLLLPPSTSTDNGCQ